MQSFLQRPCPLPGLGQKRVPAGHIDRPPEREKTTENQTTNANRWHLGRFAGQAATVVMAAIVGFSGIAPALAQDAKIAPGDAVVTGFSGIVPSGDSPPPAGSPLDTFFINLDGPSAQVLSFGALGGPPSGQLVNTAPKLVLKAGEIGQVFGIALDDGLGASVPNIYLGATSAFGIHIVRPNPAEPGKFLRLRKGHAEAQWMKGMFAEDLGGEPGSIFKVDGQTGTVNLFATLPNNSGPGVGNIVFDKASKSFYASDLDSGLIHRIDADGNVVASFDHGLTGRPAKGLASVPDDGKVMVITDPAFDTEDPKTWGYTQAERQVYGMAIHGGRLYYAVTGGQQIWSVGLNDDGAFAGDPRWELDVVGLPGTGPITDMLFDKSGRMYLAQRGTAKGSYNYSEFAAPAKSAVVRYKLEQPDDPATESRWVPAPEFYAIGKQEPHQNANGGIALGFAHDDIGRVKSGTANSMLWSTGEKLRTSLENEADPAAENDVHGLQGNDISLVRPDNVPPQQSYFLDYDGLYNDAAKAGHMGDVEIWQPVGDFARAPLDEFPPDYVPPFVDPPTVLPPLPPNPGYDLNLKLTKTADPKECFHWGPFWRCHYRINVRNMSLEHDFFGPIRVHDELVNLPAGSLIQVPQHPFPWTCFWVTAPNKFGCRRDAFLAPGASVGFNVWVLVPKSAKRCRLTNMAEIRHPLGGSWNNTDPLDDVDSATAIIPDPDCKPNLEETNLKIRKWADPQMCWPLAGNEHFCRFRALVWNDGPGVFQHKLQVQDDPAVGTTAIFGGDWNCLPNGAGHLCTHLDDPLTLFPFEARLLHIGMIVSDDVARLHNCRITNDIRIVTPHGAGHPENTVAADDSSFAFANIPAHVCEPPQIQQAVECPPGFMANGGNCVPKGKRPEPPRPPVPPVTTVDCPDGMRKVRRSQVASLRRNGWVLIRLKGGQWCGRPGQPEPPKQVCPQDMRKISTSTVRRRRAAGWSVLRLSNGQWCGRPPVVIDCPRDMRKLSPQRASVLRKRGWSVTRLSNGQWCGKPGDPVVVPCPRGMSKVPQSQVKRLSALGWQLTQLNSGQWCGRRPPVDPRPTCKQGERPVTSARAATRFRRAGYTVRQAGKRLWCVSGKPVVQDCPKGMTKVAPNQVKRLSAAGWRLTQLNSGQWCGRRPPVDPRPTCKQGERPVTSARAATRFRRAGYNVRQAGKRLWCVSGKPQPTPCPKGQVRKNGYCVPTSCPRGMVGKPPNCRKLVRPCPKGTVGRYPNCRKIVDPRPCPRGTVGRFPNCRKVVRPCPRGTVGKYPNCRKVVRPCPRGTVGKYPNCRKVVRPCPRGTVGKYPNCRRIVRPCPRGTVGKYPNCRRVVRPCPPGTVGRYPKCRKVGRPSQTTRPIRANVRK